MYEKARVMIRAVHVTGSVSRLAGGLFESVRHLSRNVQNAGEVRLSVLGLEDEWSAEDARHWVPVSVKIHRVLGPAKFGYAPEIKGSLMEEEAEVAHLHGLWRYPAVAVNAWFRRTGRPYVISPHGMLEEWALAQSPFKKAVARWLYQQKCLQKAKCLRATSFMEYESIRRAGYRNPVAIIPNGVEQPVEPGRAGTSQSEGLRTFDGKCAMRSALFLSRVHPKKGLLNLVKAWAELRPKGWQLVIAGPDEDGHLGEVRRVARTAGLEEDIVFAGEAWGPRREFLYAQSELFVLPSLSENFGLVIGEALARGLPVVTTRRTPWQELAEHRCGWWIETGVMPLVQALREATSHSGTELREMGTRGQSLVQTKYRWEVIGGQVMALYEWMLGRRSLPEWVKVN